MGAAAVVASSRLGVGANGYGLLLGALGVGSIAGALALPRLRATLSSNALLLAASLVYAVALVALVLVPNAVVILVVLIPTGIAWMAVLSSINAALQLFLPAWVRGRALSIYYIVFYGAQAGGAVLWGSLAGPLGLEATFLLAAGVLAAGSATIRLWPLRVPGVKSISYSPTGYRFGLDSPTRLVRLGFPPVEASVEACDAEPVASDGVLISVSTGEPASSATFFFRLRFGEGVGGVTSSSA